MSEHTEKYLINFAKKNPKFQIIFKGKVGVHEHKFQNILLPDNIKLIKSGTGEKYLNKDIPISNSFNIFLDISDFKYSDMEFSTSEGDSNIKLLEIMVDEFNFYDSILRNQFFELNL